MPTTTYVVSLGGSTMAPDTPDIRFLKHFYQLIAKHLNNKKFVIVVGGGGLCRQYQSVARELGVNSQEELDWLGIQVTRVNAQIVHAMFEKHASPTIFYQPQECEIEKYPICIGGGWQPGWSTDYVAATIAIENKIDNIVNLSNIDYIYDKDPDMFADAQPMKNMSWSQLKSIVGDSWQPGANWPFDPIATKASAEAGLSVAFINGQKMDEFDKYLNNQDFSGTIVE